jgi:hypothetical protein
VTPVRRTWVGLPVTAARPHLCRKTRSIGRERLVVLSSTPKFWIFAAWFSQAQGSRFILRSSALNRGSARIGLRNV